MTSHDISREAKAFEELGQILADARDTFEKLDKDKQSDYEVTWNKGMSDFVASYYLFFKDLSWQKYAELLRKIKDKNNGFTGAILAFAAWGQYEDEDEDGDGSGLQELPPEDVEEIKNNLPPMLKFKKILRENPPRQSA